MLHGHNPMKEEIFQSLFPLKNSINLPVPIATAVIGSSAVMVLIPVFSSINSSSPCNKHPPPVNTIPLSAISAANSGGVFSSTLCTASTICDVASFKASSVSSEVTVIVFGSRF